MEIVRPFIDPTIVDPFAFSSAHPFTLVEPRPGTPGLQITGRRGRSITMTISNEKKVDIALKYLDLSRAEILYRVKSSNDTLTAYAGAVGAIGAWLYKSYQDLQAGATQAHPAPSIPPATLAAGVVIAFLALVASWIVFHNERMIAALAKYQKMDLSKDLIGTNSPLWECSTSLDDGDPQSFSVVTSLIYAAMIVGPSVVAWYQVWSYRGYFSQPGGYLTLSAFMTILALVFMLLMVRDRWQLRPDGPTLTKMKAWLRRQLHPTGSH